MARTRLGTAASPERASLRGSRQRWLVAVGVLLVALNLRPAVTSLSAVLGEVRAELGLSGAMTGLLTTLPVLCFAVFGAAAPGLARRFGTHRLVSVAVAALVTGLALRALVHSGALFLAFSGLALAGIAIGNVLLPALVKRHFPERLGVMTAFYTAGMAAGTSLGAGLTVPAGQALDGWRDGLVMWAGLSVISMVPWLFMLGTRDARPVGRGNGVRPGRLARSRLAWAVAVYFGSQSLQAYSVFGWLPQIYRDAGFSAETAGAMLAVLTALGIPVSLLTPSLATRGRDQRLHVALLTACYAFGYAGLALAPHAGAWLWAIGVGVGVGGTFPLALTIIGLRTRAPAGTVALSGFAQSIGYIVSAVGPLLVGVLHDAAGGWWMPLALLGALLLPQLVAGFVAGGARYVEDELAR